MPRAKGFYLSRIWYAYFSIGHAGWEMAVRNLGIKEELGGEV